MATPSGTPSKRAALLVLPLIWACGSDPKPFVPDLPQVTVNVPEPQRLGVDLPLSVTLSGCESFASLEVLDRGITVRTYFDPGPRTDVVLTTNEISFEGGLAAQMLLTAKVVCHDGRANTSQPQPARFLPVSLVVEPSDSGQVVPDYFVAEGSGANVSFIGCAGNSLGGTSLVRVSATGKVLAENNGLPFNCSRASVITPRNPNSGKRWMWEPQVGAFAFDNNLVVSGEANTSDSRRPQVDNLWVGPDGDAVIWDTGKGGYAKRLSRHSHVNGGQVTVYGVSGFLNGDVKIFANNLVLVPQFITGVAGEEGEVAVETYYYTLATPQLVGINHMKFVRYGFLDAPYIPPVTLSEDGLTTFLAYPAQAGSSYVEACKTDGVGGSGGYTCSGANRLWQSVAIPGQVTLGMTYANGTRLAAIAAQNVSFLNTANGAVMTPEAKPMKPSGVLTARMVEGGVDGAFYLLNAPDPTQANPTPMPLELVITDKAERGDLLRFELNSGSITMALDDSNALWLRAGRKLVKPLKLSDYRNLLP